MQRTVFQVLFPELTQQTPKSIAVFGGLFMFFLHDSIQAQREMARFGAGLPSIADAADRIAATFGVVVAAYISVVVSQIPVPGPVGAALG